MGILRKATTRKSEIKVVPDEKDGTAPYVSQFSEEAEEFMESEVQGAQGQLALDVFQTADEIVVVAPIAGVKSNDVSITVTDDEDKVLTIQGKRAFHFAVDSADYFTQECFWGNFSRSIILPESVDTTKVSASFQDCILTVRVPKVEKIRTRMVKIQEP